MRNGQAETENGDKKHILILGGGFGGVYTAMHLGKMIRSDATVSLVNRENYWVYQPLLPEVVSGSIGLTDTVSPIRRLCPRASLIMREVEEIDLKNKVVTLNPGFRPRRTQIRYDYLVIALGNVTNFLGMPGMQEHAAPFRTLADAVSLRNHVIHALEEANFETDEELRRKLLTFVVAGGGFSGVEVIAELNDFVRAVTRSYPRIPREEIRCVLVHSGPRILPEVVEGLALFAEKQLRKRGVELLLNDRLDAATSEKAVLKSGLEIPTKTIVSTVPSALPPVLDALDVPKERGRLAVNVYLELKGYEGEVWVLGDCGALRTAAGNPVPPTAQHATREAKVIATNICAAIRGKERVPFTFEGLGKLGSLGHHCAVADILGVHVSGFLAWFLWRTIYFMKMPGLNRKFLIASDWFMSLLFPPDLVQLRLEKVTGITQQHFEPNEVIFCQGDVGDSVYAIQEGECEVIREVNGQREVVATLQAGSFFGEMAVLSECCRNATVKARTRMRVLSMTKSDFNKIRHTVPAFAKVFAELAERRSDKVQAAAK
ncbi:MAG: FAD-dependent oxidoreductase [Acidobacteria bacterium]|nr:FAD-dependent oxidoreductase [Acidobacteriota bacterium]